MNKIIIERNCDIELDSSLELETLENNKSNVTLHCKDKTLTFSCHVLENSIMNVDLLNINSDLEITIALEKNAEINFRNASLNSKNMNVSYQITHQEMAKSNIINHGMNLGNGFMNFTIDAIIEKGKKGAILKQDNKIINLKDGKSTIRPNLLIDEFDCFANHSAYISRFDKEEVFYLKSRGLNEEECYNLLTKSYLLGKMEITDEKKSLWIEEISKIGKDSDSFESR